MTYDALAACVYMRCNWPNRREAPTSIASRLRRFLDRIGGLDGSLAAWSLGPDDGQSYAALRDDLAAFVADQVMSGEDGTEERDAGYEIIGGSHNTREHYSLIGCVGGVYGWPLWNRLFFFELPRDVLQTGTW